MGQESPLIDGCKQVLNPGIMHIVNVLFMNLLMYSFMYVYTFSCGVSDWLTAACQRDAVKLWPQL